MDVAAELQAIYDSEINVEISWFWDCGVTVRLGDQMNGFQAEETLATIAEIVPWLQEAIAHFYPDSTYSQGLDAGLRKRAERRLFTPPRQGARVVCPHCGAPNAGRSLMEEVFVFYCARCGQSVEVMPPKVQ